MPRSLDLHSGPSVSTSPDDAGQVVRHETSGFVGAAGTPIFSQAWLPAGPPLAVVVVAHGLAEHGGRYAPLATRLAGLGVAVHLPDHRGHGRSGNAPQLGRANLGRWHDAVQDLWTQIALAIEAHPRRPVFLVGHSMGGALALDVALHHPDALRGLVLSGPALGTGEPTTGPRVAIARILSRIVPGAPVLRLRAEFVSRDPEVVRAYESDPLVHHGAIPARTAVELLDAMTRLQHEAAALEMPVLVMHGGDDRLVPLAATLPVYRRIGAADQTVRVLEGLYHEILNEPEREAVVAEMCSWILQRC